MDLDNEADRLDAELDALRDPNDLDLLIFFVGSQRLISRAPTRRPGPERPLGPDARR